VVSGAFFFSLNLRIAGGGELVGDVNGLDWRGFCCGCGLTGFWVRAVVETVTKLYARARLSLVQHRVFDKTGADAW
jgi:hypothetical protein